MRDVLSRAPYLLDAFMQIKMIITSLSYAGIEDDSTFSGLTPRTHTSTVSSEHIRFLFLLFLLFYYFLFLVPCSKLRRLTSAFERTVVNIVYQIAS